MKKILAFSVSVALASFVTSCVNSSTSFSNRGVTYQVTPELQGEHSYVADSPNAHDTSLEASKTLDAKTNASGTGAVTDNSTNEQDENVQAEEEKTPNAEEAPAEEAKEAEAEAVTE